MKTAGEKIKELREQRKMTQQELADHLSLSKSYISLAERGQRNLSHSHIQKLSVLFDKEPADFYLDKIESPEYLKSEGLRWIVLGEEMREQGVTPEQLRSWVRAIKSEK